MSRKTYTAYHKIRYVQSLNWVALPCAVKQSGSLTWKITRTNIRVPTANIEGPASNIMT